MIERDVVTLPVYRVEVNPNRLVMPDSRDGAGAADSTVKDDAADLDLVFHVGDNTRPPTPCQQAFISC